MLGYVRSRLSPPELCELHRKAVRGLLKHSEQSGGFAITGDTSEAAVGEYLGTHATHFFLCAAKC